MKSIYQYIEYIENQYAERVAFRWYDKRENRLYEKTYEEYVRDVRNCAMNLMQRFPDIKGQHICILAANSYAYIVALVGVILANGVAVPLNPNERLEVLKDEIDLVEPKLIFTDGNYQKHEPSFDAVIKTPTANLLSALEPCARLCVIHDAPERFDETAVIIFTSGTTGKNKGVMLSWRNIRSLIRAHRSNYDRWSKYCDVDALTPLAMMPFYHIGGLCTPLMFCPLGVPCYICTDISNLYQDIKLSNARYTAVPPVILEDFRANILRNKREKIANLIVIATGGASINHEILDVFSQNGIQVVDAYAMTETCGVAAASVIGETNEYKRLHSVGIMSDECETAIKDGEICFKGDVVTRGYYKDPVATAEAFDEDGWFHSGDMGYLDEEGYLFLTGRKKNLIILASGENVSPEELENLLLENASIKEVLVKEKNGKICAEIFCDEERREEVEAFIRQFNKTLPFYKQIVLREYRTTPFERTAIGKIKRQQNGD